MASNTILDAYNKQKDLCDKYNISYELFADISKSFIELNNEFIKEACKDEFLNIKSLAIKYRKKKVSSLMDDAFDRIVRECRLVEQPEDAKYTYRHIRIIRDWRLNDIFCELQYLFNDFIPCILNN